MHALIVVSHPNPKSLTHAVAQEIGRGVSASGQHHTFEIADLAAEGFDPRFTTGDLTLHLRETPPPPDVAAEHARLERADALVLVFPVYWWSFPGMLKGWIDRVFTNGWAYEEVPGGKTEKKLGHLPVHLVGIGGANMGTYDRHGYVNAMRTQIDHGIFGYCGAPVATSELLLPSDIETAPSHIAKARQIGQHLFS